MKNIKNLIMFAMLIFSAQSLTAKNVWQSVFGEPKNNKQQVIIYNNLEQRLNAEFNWTQGYNLINPIDKTIIQARDYVSNKAPVSTERLKSITISIKDIKGGSTNGIPRGIPFGAIEGDYSKKINCDN